MSHSQNKVIPAGPKVDSNTVDVNLGLRYVTIGCDLVDGTRNLDGAQKQSDIVATIPVTTESTLNGSIVNLGAQTFSLPLRNVSTCGLTFHVKDIRLPMWLNFTLSSKFPSVRKFYPRAKKKNLSKKWVFWENLGNKREHGV